MVPSLQVGFSVVPSSMGSLLHKQRSKCLRSTLRTSTRHAHVGLAAICRMRCWSTSPPAATCCQLILHEACRRQAGIPRICLFRQIHVMINQLVNCKQDLTQEFQMLSSTAHSMQFLNNVTEISHAATIYFSCQTRTQTLRKRNHDAE